MSRGRTAHIVLAVLVAAPALAFLRAEQLKLRHSPVSRPRVHVSFSPGCTATPKCVTEADLAFTLRSRQRLSMWIVDGSGRTVRHLVSGRTYPRGAVRLRWDGRSDSGTLLPDGRYRLAVDLLGEGRTVTIPDPIVLDTVPPTVQITNVVRDSTTIIRFRHAGGDVSLHLAVLQGRVVVSSTRLRPFAVRHGVVRFSAGTLSPGRYRLELFAVDAAGNRTTNPPTVNVIVR